MSRRAERSESSRLRRTGRLPRNDRLWAALFIGPQVVGLIAFALFPLGAGLALSFAHWDGLGAVTWAGLENFSDQLSDPLLRKSLLNTLLYTALTVPTGLAIALAIALALDRIRGRAIYRVIYFAPVVTSSVAVAVCWGYLLGGQDGVVNSLLHSVLGVTPPDWLADTRTVLIAIAGVTIWWTVGLNIVIFLAGLQSLPRNVLEAAEVDGVTGWHKFRLVTLPLLSPTIFFSTIVAVISSFQMFDQAYVMTEGGPLDASRTLVFHIYDLAFRSFDFGGASAVSMVLFALTLAVTVVQLRMQRRWVHYES